MDGFLGKYKLPNDLRSGKKNLNVIEQYRRNLKDGPSFLLRNGTRPSYYGSADTMGVLLNLERSNTRKRLTAF